MKENRVGTSHVMIGDTVLVLSGEHEGQHGNVRALGGAGIGVRLDDRIFDPLVRLRPDQVRVISTEEIDRAKTVLWQAGWTLTPPDDDAGDNPA